VFDFEKLEVYVHLRQLNQKVFKTILLKGNLDPYLHDQLKRAMVGVLLNLSEGTGRMSKPDKKRFYTIARSSLFECVTIMQILLDLGFLNEESYEDIYEDMESGSKMLLGMIRSMSREVI
jgi:four helix bundle protein